LILIQDWGFAAFAVIAVISRKMNRDIDLNPRVVLRAGIVGGIG
jgi:hypothetical protein